MEDIRTGTIIGRGTERQGLYYVEEVTRHGTVMLAHGTTDREAWLWHRRLGHPSGYIVLNRPWAFVQWLERATIEEEYILMAEPDHIFVNPLPNLARGEFPAGFPFSYIEPADNEKIIRKYFPKENGPVTNVDPIGNSPIIIRKVLLK
ncbi:putative GAG-pre-integrase domain-containing protein [Helianthus annuus]|nr:putative GAG-pre-integrase domain-containing protein [Helianthus annuus]